MLEIPDKDLVWGRRNGWGLVLVPVGAGVGLVPVQASASGPAGVRGGLGGVGPVGAGGVVMAGGAV